MAGDNQNGKSNPGDTILRAYRCRLEPADETNRYLFGFADARRWVWNECVAFMQDANLAAKAAGGTWPKGDTFSLTNLCKLLDGWCEGNPWLTHVPKQTLQQAIQDFIRAREAFLSRTVSAPPQFRKAAKDLPTCRFPQHVRLNQESVFFPKLGWVKYRNSFNKGRGVPPGELRNATAKFEHGHWWVSLLMQQPRQVALSTPIAAVGIDAGVKNTLALSSRRILQAPVATEAEIDRIHLLEKRVARCCYGSNRRARAQARLNKFRLGITRRLHDWRHKTTTKLAKNHGLLAAEDLALANMTASARGTVEAPGTNVAQKAGLNRALLEPGFGIINRLLAYKQDWRGHVFVQVPPARTSQRCPCGHVAKENRPTRDKFCCQRCGYEDMADFVAADNVLHDGKAIAGGRTGRTSAPDCHKQSRGTSRETSHSRTKPSLRIPIAA